MRNDRELLRSIQGCINLGIDGGFEIHDQYMKEQHQPLPTLPTGWEWRREDQNYLYRLWRKQEVVTA